jgi:hypothetical protein
MIELHYVATPNGLKVALLLEELALPYQVKSYEIFAGEHLNDEFRRINPNSRLPAIIDHAPADRGAPLSVFRCTVKHFTSSDMYQRVKTTRTSVTRRKRVAFYTFSNIV